MHFILESSQIVDVLQLNIIPLDKLYGHLNKVFDYNHLYDARFKVCY